MDRAPWTYRMASNITGPLSSRHTHVGALLSVVQANFRPTYVALKERIQKKYF